MKMSEVKSLIRKHSIPIPEDFSHWVDHRTTGAGFPIQHYRHLQEMERRPYKRIFQVFVYPKQGYKCKEFFFKFDNAVAAEEYASRVSKIIWMDYVAIYGYDRLRGEPRVGYYRCFQQGNEVDKWTQMTLNRFLVDLTRVC